jgi:hypothetical protein
MMSRQEQEMTELQNKYQTEIQTEIMTALDGGGLPKSEFTIGRIARYILMAAQRGVELKPADVLDMVKQDYNNEMKALFATSTPDQLASIAGEDMLKRLREYDLAKVRNGSGGGTPSNQPTPDRTRQSGKKLTLEEFRKRTDERAG